MAHNNEEIEIMKEARYWVLVLLSSLLMLITGCSRRDIVDDYPDGIVKIKLDWGELTHPLPEAQWIVIYPEDSSLKPLAHELNSDELVDTLPRGHYRALLLAMNKGVENLEFVQMEQLASGTIRLKGPIEGTRYPYPDLVYSTLMDIDLKSNKSVSLVTVPKPLAMRAIFEIKIPGMRNLQACLRGIPVGIDVKNLTAIFVNPADCIELTSEYANEVVTLSGTILMPLVERSTTRVSPGDALIHLEISVTYENGKTEEIKVNVTEAVKAAAAQEPGEVIFELVKIGMNVTVVQWEAGTGNGDVS